jgi:hypothetical protein
MKFDLCSSVRKKKRARSGPLFLDDSRLLRLPASVETTSVITASPIMKLAVVPSSFSMKRTMPPVVAVTKPIVETIVATF